MPIEQHLSIGQRVDRDADPADLFLDIGIIGVVAALSGQVQGDGQSGAALPEEVLVALIGLLGRPEAGVLAKRPELVAVATGEVPTSERRFARFPDALRIRIVRPVDAATGRPLSVVNLIWDTSI